MRIDKGTMGVFPLSRMVGMSPLMQTLYIWCLNLQNLNPYPPTIDDLVKCTGIEKQYIVDLLKTLHQEGLVSDGYWDEQSQTRSVYFMARKPKKAPAPKKGPVTTWLTPYEVMWKGKTGGLFPFDRAARPLRTLEAKYGRQEVQAAFGKYLKDTDIKMLSIPYFATHFEAFHKKEYQPKLIDKDSTPGW